MAGKPPESSPPTHSQTAAGGRSDERAAQTAESTQPIDEPTLPAERTGPVSVSRLRKADGRALILYGTVRERV
jgi:hypothetical protein